MANLHVVEKYPSEYATNVYINDRVWAQFSVPISTSTATYYNFTVNEKNTYEPVDGEIVVTGISGDIQDCIIQFIPTNGFTRDTEYSVLVSTAVKSKNGDHYLEDDLVWYFSTGSQIYSGLIGDYDPIIPSGTTEDDSVAFSYLDPSGYPLEVMETIPIDFATNQNVSLPYIGIKFNGIIPSGFNLYNHIKLSSRKVLG